MKRLTHVLAGAALVVGLSWTMPAVNAAPAQKVTMEFDLQMTGPGIAEGLFVILDVNGQELVSGEAVETFFFVHESPALIVAKGVKTLTADGNTMTIDFRAVIRPEENGLMHASATWCASGGSGDLARVHGAGVGEAWLDPFSGELLGSYGGTLTGLPSAAD